MTRIAQHRSSEKKLAHAQAGVESLARRPGTPATGDIVLQVKVVADDVVIAISDGQFFLAITEELDGMALTDCGAWVSTVSSSGGLLIQLHNVTAAVDMLSTRISIDVSEKHSKDAATPPVISNPNVTFGDQIRVDVDDDGTGARGLGVDFYFGTA